MSHSDTNPVKKAALFVDVQNIYYTCKEVFNRQFNYSALWSLLDQHYQIVVANAYAINRGDHKQQQFQNTLRKMGFDVKLKPFIQRVDGSAKGDWDVGITIDVLTIAPQVDTVILLSGDGDFALLLEHIAQHFSVNTQVFGAPRLTAKSLIDAANDFVQIDDRLLL